MSPVLGPTFTWLYGFPRVSGDEPGISSVIQTVWGFSPRERG